MLKEDEGTGFIEDIEPRQSQLVRPAVVNVDQLAIIIAIKAPEPDFMLLDKLLITAEKEHIEPFICINKIDLDAEGNYEKIAKIYNSTGYHVITMSSKTDVGIDDFKKEIIQPGNGPCGTVRSR